MLYRRHSIELPTPARSGWTVAPALAALLSAVLLSAAVAAQPPRSGEAQRRGATNRDRSNAQHLNEKGFPLNVDSEIVSAGKAPIEDGDMVMGVVHNGEARAYPVNYMNGPLNEVVNDRLGGTAIAPSW